VNDLYPRRYSEPRPHPAYWQRFGLACVPKLRR
jgi:hypothetical protein